MAFGQQQLFDGFRVDRVFRAAERHDMKALARLG
jgi:hypothetical protein